VGRCVAIIIKQKAINDLCMQAPIPVLYRLDG
jgi:hypothetical protein